MSLFENEARQFKFDVLREVSTRKFMGELDATTPETLAHLLIPNTKADFRCCVYKEREVIRERTRLAMGEDPVVGAQASNPKQIVRVMEAACDGCSIKKIRVTDNCRKCMAKSCIAACRFDALRVGENSVYIDYNKCKECGACVNACSYSAIVETSRPCKKSCSVDAIVMDEYNIAKIKEDKCINCGACQSACPFGAIEDVSFVTQTIDLLVSEQPVVAIVAPSIQGQYDAATLPQIFESIKRLGFNQVFEAAIAADIVAWHEKDELLEYKEQGKKMTTSCCPAFVNMAKLHFPEVYENNVSSMASPMVAMAKYVKVRYPDHKIVFVGPCVAKKQEAMDTEVDFVITFEELAAMLVSQHIWPEAMEATLEDHPSLAARNFAIGGGVAKAVAAALLEDGCDIPVTSEYADGAFNCKKALLLMKMGRFTPDILEGMACIGGCVSGPASVEKSAKVKGRMAKENLSLKDSKVKTTVERWDFKDLNLHVR
ncbi:MAG: monomeric [FeFe] hydrogenase [Erysipelotrichaceae bacterium]